MGRIIGVFEKPAAATAIGVLLCVATVAVFVTALVLANMDRLNEKHTEQPDSSPVAAVEITIKESENETGEKEPEEVEAGPSHSRELPADAADEEKLEEGGDTTSLVQTPAAQDANIFGVLCGGGQQSQMEDTTTMAVTGTHAEEIVRLREENARLRKENAIQRKALADKAS